MLAAHHRLRRSDDFRRAVRRGSRSSRPTLVVHQLRPSSPDRAGLVGDEKHEPAQVGFVVSRRVGNAVVRNQVARRLRHLVGHRLNQLEPGSLIVVRAHPAAAEASSATLGDDFDACLAALRVQGRSSTSGRGRR